MWMGELNPFSLGHSLGKTKKKEASQKLCFREICFDTNGRQNGMKLGALPCPGATTMAAEGTLYIEKSANLHFSSSSRIKGKGAW